MSDVVCRTTRSRIVLREEYLRLTVLTFERHMGRTVTMDEAREIAENTLVWMEWIADEEVTSAGSSATL
ncbi:MAG: hypothetical protein KIT79_13485 [Deltaproteobacteria bacterium]|nr:hypothetical protein [Deltaproteobacteria bacterium]